ncbi:arginine N-succinyltransferase [Proteobacteria bacterium 005FR1]|nr:arginine N-succinyltransferase [Proteobacteria bacterium 005FR1]
MWVVRPAQPDDLGSILQIVRTRGRGLSSTLPRDRHALDERIALSRRSFAGQLSSEQFSTYGNGRFMFVLENTEHRKICGVSAIDSRAGNGEPFYSYRRDCLIHASRELGISRRVEVLFPSHAITNRSLLCGFAIEAELVGTPAFQLLSRARMLFIASHRHLFADEIAVEIQGLQQPDGQVPFWDSLGRHFFNMDFKTADEYSAKLSKTFIAELMPPSPIYLSLLSEEAQRAVGQAHRAAEPACKLLESEGFAPGCYVDIFDAGPVLEARTDQLNSLRSSRTKVLDSNDHTGGPDYLLAAGDGIRFRATLGPAKEETGRAATSGDARERLNCRAGDALCLANLIDESAVC